MTTTTLSARRDALLRLALQVDALITGVNGAAYLLLAGPLHDLLGLSTTLLRAEGAFLLVFAAGVALLSTRPSIPRLAVLGVILINVDWALHGVVAAAADWGDPSTAGAVWLVLQAIVVGAFAALQYAGLRRAATA